MFFLLFSDERFSLAGLVSWMRSIERAVGVSLAARGYRDGRIPARGMERSE
jgi:hypothetical protein